MGAKLTDGVGGLNEDEGGVIVGQQAGRRTHRHGRPGSGTGRQGQGRCVKDLSDVWTSPLELPPQPRKFIFHCARKQADDALHRRGFHLARCPTYSIRADREDLRTLREKAAYGNASRFEQVLDEVISRSGEIAPKPHNAGERKPVPETATGFVSPES